MLTDFYIAFATVCFTLLGLWIIVVQTRHAEWRRRSVHRRRAYGIALHFSLPGVMGLLSLIDPASTTLWRISFAIAAMGELEQPADRWGRSSRPQEGCGGVRPPVGDHVRMQRPIRQTSRSARHGQRPSLNGVYRARGNSWSCRAVGGSIATRLERWEDRMRIGIIGAGSIGHALAVRFAAAGHQVMLSNSRGPDTLTAVAASIQGDVRAGTVQEAARFGEVVAVAIPLRAIRDLPPEPFAGRVVIDANNYWPQRDGHIPELDADQTTSSELLAAQLPGATVVKAFNTVFFQRLLDDSHPELPAGDRLEIPVAGDDANAKRTVIDLIDQIGFTGVDAGTLAESRRLQPGHR